MRPAMTDTAPDYAGLSRRLGALAYHIQQTGTTDSQDAQTCLEVAEALSTLLERNKELERERDQLLDKLHCMCGSPIDHSAWEGHTPVSVYDYSLDQERSRAEAAEARLAEKDAELAAMKVSNNKWLAKWERAEACLAEVLKALDALDRMNCGLDWCDQDEQARRWADARRALTGGKVDG